MSGTKQSGWALGPFFIGVVWAPPDTKVFGVLAVVFMGLVTHNHAQDEGRPQRCEPALQQREGDTPPGQPGR